MSWFAETSSVSSASCEITDIIHYAFSCAAIASIFVTSSARLKLWRDHLRDRDRRADRLDAGERRKCESIARRLSGSFYEYTVACGRALIRVHWI